MVAHLVNKDVINLSEHDLYEYSDSIHIKNYYDGEHIINTSDAAKFFLIVQGSVSISRLDLE